MFGCQVEKIFSKNFAVKEEGLRNLQKALSDYKRGDKNSKLYDFSYTLAVYKYNYLLTFPALSIEQLRTRAKLRFIY